MTKFKQLLLAAALVAPGALAAAPAAAQVSGVAVVNLEQAVATSKAFQAARTQIQTTYKAQIDQATARQSVLQAEINTLITQFQAAQRAPGATQASLQPQYTAIQQRQQAAQQELARITAPADRATAYVLEQVQGHLNDAVGNVVRAKNISVLLQPQAAMYASQAADVTPAVTAELDRIVPSVSAAVPANWQPGQQQAGGGAPAPASGGRNSQGR